MSLHAQRRDLPPRLTSVLCSVTCTKLGNQRQKSTDSLRCSPSTCRHPTARPMPGSRRHPLATCCCSTPALPLLRAAPQTPPPPPENTPSPPLQHAVCPSRAVFPSAGPPSETHLSPAISQTLLLCSSFSQLYLPFALLAHAHHFAPRSSFKCCARASYCDGFQWSGPEDFPGSSRRSAPEVDPSSPLLHVAADTRAAHG